MIYVIDHKDSFTHNVVHQLSLFDEVECDNYNNVDKIKLNKAKVIVFSPGPGEKIITEAFLSLLSFISL